jgi:hypothetical protein
MADKYEIGEAVTGPTGQAYVLVSREPYERPDGSMSEILHWRSNCRKCGAQFVAKAGPTAHGTSIHCPAHRLSREERTANWLAAMRTPEARRKAAATMKRRAEIRKLF